MSMFYCDYHNKLEDSDFVGYVSDEDGNSYCDDGMAEFEAECEIAAEVRAMEQSEAADFEYQRMYEKMDEPVYDEDF